MRVAGPAILSAAYRPSRKSEATTHFSQECSSINEADFSKDFLGVFIEAPTAGSLMKRAGLSDNRTADPFIKHKAETQINVLAAEKSYRVQNDLQLILSFRETKKASWWHGKVILAGLNSLLSIAKKTKAEQAEESRLTKLERSKARLEKLSEEIEALHEKHLYNEKRIAPEVRKKEHDYYLLAKKHTQQAYDACVADIALSQEDGATTEEAENAAIFMQAYGVTSRTAQPFSPSSAHEPRRLTEGVEANEASRTASTSSNHHQASRRSTSSEPTREKLAQIGAYPGAVKRLARFSQEIELKSPDPGLVKKAHDFLHHEAMVEVIALSSAIAHTAKPGIGYIPPGLFAIIKSIIKGILYFDASFREVEYENAFRTQLKNIINSALKEVHMYSTGDIPRAAAAAAGYAAGALDGTLKQNTAAMEDLKNSNNALINSNSALNDVILSKLETIEAAQRRQEENQRRQEAKQQKLEAKFNSAAQKIGLQNNDSNDSLASIPEPENLDIGRRQFVSPAVSPRMAQSAFPAASTSTEAAQRPTTPELNEFKEELKKEFKETIDALEEKHAKEKAELREEARKEREALAAQQQKQQEEMFAKIASLFAAQQPQQPN